MSLKSDQLELGFSIHYYCIGNIGQDKKLTFNNKEYMTNLHINLNIHLFQSSWKTLCTENFSIIIATNFDNLMSVASLFEIKSSLYLRIFGLA